MSRLTETTMAGIRGTGIMAIKEEIAMTVMIAVEGVTTGMGITERLQYVDLPRPTFDGAGGYPA